MADNQTQLDPQDPWAVKAQQLGMGAQPLASDDPWAIKGRQLISAQTLDPNDPWAAKAKQMGISSPEEQEREAAEEAERTGEGENVLFRPITTYFGVPEYRKGAGPVERGVEKFASGLVSPLSLGLMLVTGGLGGLAEAGTATAGEEAALSLSGRVGAQVLKGLTPEVAAKVATASGVISKLANLGFTAQQINNLADRVPQFGDAIRSGDSDRAIELGTTMLLEGTAAKLSTSHLLKTMGGAKGPVWTRDKEVIAASQRPVRQAGTEALEFRRANDDLIRNKPLDTAAYLYHEAGGDPATLEKWRQDVVDDSNIRPAIRQKYDGLLRDAQTLPDSIKALSSELRLKYGQEWEYLKAQGKVHPNSTGAANYAGPHEYVPDDEGASTLRYVGLRKLTKTPAFLKPRSFDTIVDALKAGFEPNVGLAGAREQYIRSLGAMRGAIGGEKSLMGQTADDNRPVGIDPARVRTINGHRVIPVEPGTEVGDIGERRVDFETRKRINEMSPEEMRRELTISKVTGLPNRRAFEEGSSLAVAMSDADGLKAFNDKFGYAAGDVLLRAKAEALRDAGIEAYHDKGDEFIYRGNGTAELAQKLETARRLLRDRTIEIALPDGSTRFYKGADFSYGAGRDLTEAERFLKEHKAAREAAGERARGELRGIAEVTAGRALRPGAPQITRVPGTVRPEDFLRRVGADKASILKEGADDLAVQNLRDAYKAGVAVEPIELILDEDGRVRDANGRHRALAALQAGIERIPIVTRRLMAETRGELEPARVRWPSDLDPITDKEIIGRAIAEVSGTGAKSFDELPPKTQDAALKRAADIKVREKTAAAPGPTAVRKPVLMPGGTNILANNGRLYWIVDNYTEGPNLFRRFRYKATDKYGDPVFERANVLVHPDYAKAINKAFDDDSWFRQNPLMRMALGTSMQAKKTLLSFSPFHFNTMYLRGIQMGLGPLEALHPRTLTADRLAVRSKFGPMFGVESQRSLAAEGSATNIPLIHKLPLGVGKFLANNEERLFGGGGYIDRLKADAFEKVVDQVSKRHPNWTTDQVHFASSKLVDAAFGGLNWKMLGMSMNGVDALRLIALAPDFSGSQILFAKYGLEPGGSVVGQSLARIALYNFGVARVLNMLISGKPHFEHPFGVVSPDDKKVYSMRTMPQDIYRALTDPRQFIYNRLNPLLTRSVVEAMTGRDERGRAVTYQSELHDLLRNVLPISSQNFVPSFRREDESIATGIARGLGVVVEPDVTTAYRLAGKLASNRNESGPVEQDKLERHQSVLQMEDALRSGAIKPSDLNDAIEHDTLSRDEAKQIWKNVQETQGMDQYTARLYSRAGRLPMADFIKVYDIATPQEKKVLTPLLEKKARTYLKNAQEKMVASVRLKDPTYLRLRRDLANVPLF
jgi:GGDEF domain-containing protein